MNQERLELQAEVAALCRGREAGEAAQAALRGRAAELAAVVRDTESANAVLQAELSAKAQVLEELGHKDAFETQSLLRALRRDKSDLLETVTDLEKDNARELERVQDEHDAELRDRADRVEEQRVRATRLERELGRLRQDAAVLEAILGRAVAHIDRLPDGHLHASSFSLAAFTLRTLEPEERRRRWPGGRGHRRRQRPPHDDGNFDRVCQNESST